MSMIKKIYEIFKIEVPEGKEEIYAQDVMLHRIKCKFLYLDFTKNEIQDAFFSSNLFILPVCRETSDDIVGCYSLQSYLHDCIQGAEMFASKQNIVFVPIKTILQSIIDYTYNKNFLLIVVVDGYGGTQGIITQELLWQAIYKDLFVQQNFVAIEGSFVLNGETEFEDVKDLVVIEEFEQLKSFTLGGLIIEYLSKVPMTGEMISIGSYEIKIIDSNATTVKKLSITPLKKK